MACTVMVGIWAPGLLTFARACWRHGREARLLDVGDPGGPLPRCSRCVTHARRFDRALIGTAAGVAAVRAYCEAAGADSIAASEDDVLLWLAENRALLEPQFRVMAPPAGVLRALEPKTAQIDVARGAGLDVLPTWLLSSAADCGAAPGDAFPLALRPDRRGAVRPDFKVRVAGSPEALRAFVGAHECSANPIVAQPFHAAPNLIVHGVQAEDGARPALEAFLVSRKYHGITLTIERTTFPDGVRNACAAFVEAAGIVGPFHFELLLPRDGWAYFLEVNVRIGGTTDKVARLGYDESALTLRAFGLLPERAVAHANAPLAGRCVNKRVLLAHMRAASRGRVRQPDYPEVGRLANIALDCRDLVTARDSLLDWQDLRGTLWFYGLGAAHRAADGARRRFARRRQARAGLRRAKDEP